MASLSSSRAAASSFIMGHARRRAPAPSRRGCRTTGVASSMAVSVRAERFASSAQTSRVAAACTLLREQPDTPGPQPRLGSKAAAVPSTLNSEFSSKSLLNSPEVSACAVLLGALSLLTLDAQKPKSLRGRRRCLYWSSLPAGCTAEQHSQGAKGCAFES